MKRPDIAVLASSVALSAIGLVFIYSASSYNAALDTGDAFFFVKKQAIAMALGVVLMFFVKCFDVEKLKRFKTPVLIFSLVLLALVFVPGVGVESYGAKRWINLGFFTVQPSEYAKFGLVIFIAAFMSARDMNKTKNIAAVLFAGLSMCALIILEPNMSITVCVGAVMLAMLFVGGVKIKKFFVLMLPFLIAVPALIIAEPYRIKRMTAFLNPWENPQAEGYQLIQSYYALGSGGWFGLGIGNSRQKYLFLPFSESDFILSVIGEETGLAGVMLLLLIFGVFIYAGVKIAVSADTRFKCYLAAGITAVVAVQTAVNAAVVSGTIPPTGLPLPFVSAGGSSLVAFLLASGVLAGCRGKGGVKSVGLPLPSATKKRNTRSRRLRA